MNRPAREDSASDHAYFLALEEAFIRLRGAPLLLSPADWQVAKRWRGKGIPLEMAIRVMERIFERQRESGASSGIRSLRYFQTAVLRSWQRVLELGGGDRDDLEVEEMDLAARLGRLAAALPSETVERQEPSAGDTSPERILAIALEGIAEAITGSSGPVRDVESKLQRLDRSMLDRVREQLDPETLADLEGAAAASLAEVSERLAPEERERTLRLLVRRRLRQQFGLPVLSLFSREATGPDS